MAGRWEPGHSASVLSCERNKDSAAALYSEVQARGPFLLLFLSASTFQFKARPGVQRVRAQDTPTPDTERTISGSLPTAL